MIEYIGIKHEFNTIMCAISGDSVEQFRVFVGVYGNSFDEIEYDTSQKIELFKQLQNVTFEGAETIHEPILQQNEVYWIKIYTKSIRCIFNVSHTNNWILVHNKRIKINSCEPIVTYIETVFAE